MAALNSFVLDESQKHHRGSDISVDRETYDELRSNDVDDVLKIKDIRGQLMEVFRGDGPKAYFDPRKSKGVEELSLPEEDDRWGKLVPVIKKGIKALSEEDFKEFYKGKSKLELEIPLEDVADIDFADSRVEFSDWKQAMTYEDRQNWVSNMFVRLSSEAVHDVIRSDWAKEVRYSMPYHQWQLSRADVRLLKKEDDVLKFVVYFNTPRKFKVGDTLIEMNDDKLKIVSSIPPLDQASDLTSEESGTASNILRLISDKLSTATSIDNAPLDIEIEGLITEKMADFFRKITELKGAGREDVARRLLKKTGFYYIKELYSLLSSLSIPERNGENMELALPDGEKELYVPAGTQSALQQCPVSEIKTYVEKAGMTFYLTGVRSVDGHLQCLIYVEKDGVLYPRIAYKSRSGKKWVLNRQFSTRTFIKGLYSYTTEMLPFMEMDDALFELESGEIARDQALNINDDDPEIDSYDREGVYFAQPPEGLEELVAFDSEWGLNSREEVDRLYDDETIPDDFVPDFSSEPLSIRRRSGCVVEEYLHNYCGMDFRFYMSKYDNGDVWVYRIEDVSQDGNLTTYGTRKAVLEFGPFALKPKDYRSRVLALNPDRNWIYRDQKPERVIGAQHREDKPVEAIVPDNHNTEYLDISPLRNNLKLIRRYKEQKGFS